MKIKNEKKKGLAVNTSIGLLIFDENGVTDVKSEDFAKELLELDGYESAESVVEETKEDEEDLESLTVFQLKKIAKEKNIDIGDAKKKVELIKIIRGFSEPS